MPQDGAVVVVGGTRAIGLEIGKHFAARGDDVVLTGQDPAHVEAAVAETRALSGGRVDGATFDLSDPTSIAPALAGVGTVRHVVLVAIDRVVRGRHGVDTHGAERRALAAVDGHEPVAVAAQPLRRERLVCAGHDEPRLRIRREQRTECLCVQMVGVGVAAGALRPRPFPRLRRSPPGARLSRAAETLSRSGPADQLRLRRPAVADSSMTSRS